MSKKRIKILVSKLVLDILERDSKHFNVTKEKLCNDILINLSLKGLKGIEREEYDEKAYLQFTLSQGNAEYYKIISKEIEDEPKFIRGIFTSYIHLNPFYREILLFRDKLLAINNYIFKQEELNIAIRGSIDKVLIQGITRCHLTDYVKLQTNKGEFYMNELRMIF